MSRILQIRRGTTAQNDNFTGMEGEITIDTDKNILRVHDGKTLGGFAMARADMIASGDEGHSDNFDINTVPDEFWQTLFSKYAPKPKDLVQTDELSIYNVAYAEYVLSDKTPVKYAYAVLICKTAEAGYSVGDVVCAFGVDNRANPAPNVYTDKYGLHLQLMIGSGKFWVSHKDTGVNTNITNENWAMAFRVCY